MSQFVDRYIEELYAQMNEKIYSEASAKMLSISMPAEEAFLIKAISDNFGVSLSAFCSEILSNACRQAFVKLTPTDRIRIAEEADQLTSEYLEKQGITQTTLTTDGERQGSFCWSSMCSAMAEFEATDRKKAGKK